MTEDKTRRAGPVSSNIQEILRERERLDQILQQEFRKEVAILFTDICGYTSHIDTRGDISGRTLLLRHNRIVLPLIEKNEGKVVEMIGDAVMASFSNPLEAVKASIAIQRALYDHNEKTEAADRIHVKIGINVGKVLVDEAVAYQSLTGDVVNVASRIQSEAVRDQVLISRAVYEQVSGSEDILCRFHGTIRAKGKAKPLELYRVVWQDEDIVLDHEQKLRTDIPVAERRSKPPLKLFQLEITLRGDHLELGAHEQTTGKESTIRHYEEIPVSMDLIQTKCREMVDTLNKANRKGCVTRDVLLRLREIGQVLHDELFSLNVKEKLKNTKAEYLTLRIDDQLVQIPWELLNDGKHFLCQRFNIGRLVKTRQPILGIRTRLLAKPLKMLILADPEGDLKGAYAEGVQIREHMDRDKDLINVSFLSGNITPDSIKEKIRNFDFVHFAGHADFDPQNAEESGWRLTKGSLKAKDIAKMASTIMPSLIFSNACQSARTDMWVIKVDFQDEIFGLANSFLLAGVKHYVGTFWEISDEPSSRFASKFYKYLFSGMTIGEAIRWSRLALIKEYGEESIVWASYVLYGDPTFNYREQIEETNEQVEPEPIRVPTPEGKVRALEEVVDFADKGIVKRNRIWLSVPAGIALLVAIMLWGYPGFLKEGTIKYEKAALAYYNEGNFKEALNACRILEDKNPKVCLTYLISGNIHLTTGKLDAAEVAYRKALRFANGTDVERAQALIGLGRIASIRKQPTPAIKYYQQATEICPESKMAYLSGALLQERMGNYDEALDLFNKAQGLAPKDLAIRAIAKETREKVSLAKDQGKQERIDRIVKELIETMERQSRELPSDGWTSRPLTMWLMDFKVQGYSLQEGQERLLVSGITDQLLQHSRTQLVERVLLDKLVEELNLGTSKLIEHRTVLSLGKILAARLILSGQVVYSGSHAQVSMRLIEIETGRIAAAINESFGSAVPASVLAERLSKSLLEKLKVLYPLRGKILEAKDEEIRLNIGQMVGVRSGQRLKVIDEDVTLEVTSIQKDTSLTKIVKGKGPFQKSLRVEAI